MVEAVFDKETFVVMWWSWCLSRGWHPRLCFDFAMKRLEEVYEKACSSVEEAIRKGAFITSPGDMG